MRADRLAVLAAGLALLGACGQKPVPPSALHGFVEAEPVRVATPAAGRLVALEVETGDQVAAGDRLFVLESETEQAAVEEARARVTQAQAQEADLATGKRPQEIAALEASLRAGEVSLREAQDNLERDLELLRKGFIAESAVVAARARRDSAAAQVDALAAQVGAARLAARGESRRAASAAVEAATSQLEQRRLQLERRVVAAPVAGRVEARYFRLGEWVNAGSPVLSLLPAAAVKARFFVPETLLARMRPGLAVWLACDGCGAPIEARVSFVAREAEFTPPVLYSRENRATLVWMVEAAPSAIDAQRLRPGQPIDVMLEPPR
ncbi:MAG: HlyD family efflux transporter periplasmic adaptor subunit [Burkholderiales bacterium]|nr:MAG: HlyD family efflux transporter periplasmic adaptor subunit [Burkholderiales bacterium]